MFDKETHNIWYYVLINTIFYLTSFIFSIVAVCKMTQENFRSWYRASNFKSFMIISWSIFGITTLTEKNVPSDILYIAIVMISLRLIILSLIILVVFLWSIIIIVFVTIHYCG